MNYRNRKYCYHCKNKFSPHTFDMHKQICRSRQQGQPTVGKCLHCGKDHDCSYGSGVYCDKTCQYKDRKRYNKTCSKCQRTISINNYTHHIKSCQGLTYNTEVWKIEDDRYECPMCDRVFNKMGISPHYIKKHGRLPKSIIKPFTTISEQKQHTNCLVCSTPLSGKQRMYCSSQCKGRAPKISKNNYESQKRRAIEKKLGLVLKLGGKCQACGYNKNISSLCFHHTDNTKKLFSLDANTLAKMGFQTICDEAEKCKLLCHNCHSEHHNPQMDTSTLLKLFDKQMAEIIGIFNKSALLTD